ncbi:MAG: prepilin-type N-terminal cleavage/methylation domain-containing protein [Actinobacteria bacterium]|nr:prepilin-type N-terminal cleavage/methylation domain-containing protein [Actinomycetota bacterium]
MNKKHQEKPFSIAFTLVELLVVISIIGLLAGLAIPAINGGLKSAKAGACLSNLHQIGVATMAYAADNSFKLPDAGSGTSDMWATKLATFISTGTKSKKSIFVCPGCEKTVVEATGTDVAVTYGVHNGLMPKGGTASNISSVVRATEVILAGDVCQNPGNKGWSPFCIEQPSIISSQSGGRGGSTDLTSPITVGTDSDNGNNPWLRYRHSGKVNVVMCDGHAEAIKKGSVLNKHVIFGQ